MLALGIPANAVMALMMGAMIIQGIVPGPQVVTSHPQIFWGLIVSMWAGNLMLVILNLPLIGLWVRLVTIPYSLLFPCILAFCLIGAYSTGKSEFDLLTVLVCGIGGFVLLQLGYETVPFLLGFILGPKLEEHLIRALITSRGSPLVFVTEPISAALLATAVLLLVLLLSPAFVRRRKEIFVES